MKKSKKSEKSTEKKALSREELLNGLKAPEPKTVEVPGLGPVELVPLTFPEIVQIIADAGEQQGDRETMMVAAVCKELKQTDAHKLRTTNGFIFAALYKAINDFLGYSIDKEKIKNL